MQCKFVYYKLAAVNNNHLLIISLFMTQSRIASIFVLLVELWEGVNFILEFIF